MKERANKMFKKILIAFVLMFSFSGAAMAGANAQFCKRNSIYCAIVKLKPTIDKKFAMDLSNSIYKYSRRNNVDPYRVVAIAMQESSLSPVVRYETVNVRKTICAKDRVCVVRYVKEKERLTLVSTNFMRKQ